MWKVLLAVIIAVGLGFLGLQISNWLLSASVGFLADLLGLTITAVGFWLLYRFFADKVEKHEADEARKQAIHDAYQAGLEEGRRQALQGQNDAG